jgi:hypothetical protein
MNGRVWLNMPNVQLVRTDTARFIQVTPCTKNLPGRIAF